MTIARCSCHASPLPRTIKRRQHLSNARLHPSREHLARLQETRTVNPPYQFVFAHAASGWRANAPPTTHRPLSSHANQGPSRPGEARYPPPACALRLLAVEFHHSRPTALPDHILHPTREGLKKHISDACPSALGFRPCRLVGTPRGLSKSAPWKL